MVNRLLSFCLFGVWLLVGCADHLAVRQAAEIAYRVEQDKADPADAAAVFHVSEAAWRERLKEIERKPAWKEEYDHWKGVFHERRRLKELAERKRQEKINLVDRNLNPETREPLNAADKEVWIWTLHRTEPGVAIGKISVLRDQQKKMFFEGKNPHYLDGSVWLEEPERRYWKTKLFSESDRLVADKGGVLNRWFAEEEARGADRDWTARTPAEVAADEAARRQALADEHLRFDLYHYYRDSSPAAATPGTPLTRQEEAGLLEFLGAIDYLPLRESLERLRRFRDREKTSR